METFTPVAGHPDGRAHAQPPDENTLLASQVLFLRAEHPGHTEFGLRWLLLAYHGEVTITNRRIVFVATDSRDSPRRARLSLAALVSVLCALPLLARWWWPATLAALAATLGLLVRWRRSRPLRLEAPLTTIWAASREGFGLLHRRGEVAVFKRRADSLCFVRLDGFDPAQWRQVVHRLGEAK